MVRSTLTSAVDHDEVGGLALFQRAARGLLAQLAIAQLMR